MAIKSGQGSRSKRTGLKENGELIAGQYFYHTYGSICGSIACVVASIIAHMSYVSMCGSIWQHNMAAYIAIVRACGQFNQELALLGIHTPIGSAFNPVVYLYCLFQTRNKESFSHATMQQCNNATM